ncbi:hypothetical protein DM860_002527 [Cuscuta australis]|uniref:Uncharacterized protein n=1 Tax=Cuscuta australis TaxID=267555 RepID=A0A328D2D1_9ASTE|nr:hypothetical protein DM860_002527 [Cuscuta australis]
MEISLFSDTMTTVSSTHSVVFSKSLLNRHHSFTSNHLISLSDDQQSPLSSTSIFVQISAAVCPTDVVAPPPVGSNRIKAAPRRLARKARRVRRKLAGGGGGGEFEHVFGGGDGGGSFGGGDGGGSFGGGNSWGGSGGGGGGGMGWNFNGFGGSNWGEEPSFNSSSDPAFDFVYKVLSWIMFSNCLHFAFTKVIKTVVTDGDPAREKVPVTLTDVC